MGLNRQPGGIRGIEPQPRSVAWLTAGLAALAVFGTITAARLTPAGDTPAVGVLLGFFAALVVAGTLNLEYHFRGQVDAFDHFEVVLTLALAVLPVPIVVPLAAVAKASSQALRRVTPVKAAFNVVQWSAATAAGALVLAPVRSPWPVPPHELGWLALAMMVVSAVNAGAVTFVLALVGRRAPLTWRSRPAPALARTTLVPTVVNVSFGLLFVGTYAWSPAVSPLLLVPLALLHWASRGHVLGVLQESRLAASQRATRALAGATDHEAGLTAFLAAIGSGFDRNMVDLAVAAPDGSRQERRWRRDPDQAAPPADALLTALAETHSSLRLGPASGSRTLRRVLSTSGFHDCVAAPVRVAGTDVGVLCLYDARGPVAFPDQELTVVTALADAAAAALERIAADAVVVAERGRLARIVNESADGTATVDDTGLVLTWNPAFERMTGWPADVVVGRMRLDVLQPMDAHDQRVFVAADAPGDLPPEVRILRRNGESRWLSCSYASTAAIDGEPNRLIVTARDITDLKRSAAVLDEQIAILELVARGAPLRQTLNALAAELAAVEGDAACAILLTDRLHDARLQLAAAVGLTEADLAALEAFTVGPDANWTGRAIHERRPVVIRDVATDEPSADRRDAALHLNVLACWALPVADPNAGRLVGVVAVFFRRPRSSSHVAHWSLLEHAAHVTAIAVARADFENRLAHQATHDALTGLPNRVAFLDRCELAIKRAQRDATRAVVMFLDLDGFKIVNDSMGHSTGDRLLVSVAERLQRILRPSDTVARFGGDEFTILCEGVADITYVVGLADRVHAALAPPFLLRGREVLVHASVGIAIGDEHTEPGDLINNADAAMYRAKQRGGNRHEVFDPRMRGPDSQRPSTESELHRGLELGEFVVYYQPLVALDTGDVTGVEALVRWQHPNRGLLNPEAFLPLAESSGLILPISSRVFELAAAQMSRWQAEHPDRTLTMSVNLSPCQLADPSLTDGIAALVQDSGLPPETLCLEITEAALMDDNGTSTTTLRQLKAIGVRIAIDDFGTANSSLSHLKQYPVDWLKIDGSFVSGMGSDRGDGSMVTAVISLAHSLGLSTIAEGIETVGQLLELRRLGCDAGQGFYLWPPMPGDDLLHNQLRTRLPELDAVAKLH